MKGFFKTHYYHQLNILWAGQSILIAMLAMSLPFWPLYLAELGNFTGKELRFWSAAIYIAPFISSIFSSPLWGKLGDKYGYKPMVIRACFGLFITQLLILLVPNVYWIFIFRLLQGVLAGFIVSAQALALAISPDHEKGTTMGKLSSATAIGNLFGPLMGGIIATYGGYHAIFNFSVVICAVITLVFWFTLDNPAPLHYHDDEKPLTHNNFIHLFHGQIAYVLVIIALIQIARSMITPIFALFVTEKLSGGDMTIGILYAATGLMIFLTAPKWGRYFDKLSRGHDALQPIIAMLLFLSALFQVLHAFTESATVILILRLLWGICLGALLPTLLKMLTEHAHKKERGLYLGLGNSATKFGNLIGIMLGAVIEGTFGFTSSFIVTASLYILAGILILLPATTLQTIKDNEFKHEQ